MFVEVKTSGGWYVFPGKLVNGEMPDLLTGASEASYDKPDLVSATFPSARWRKLYVNLRKDRHADVRQYVGRYLWNQWQATHPPKEQLVRLRIYYIKYRPDEMAGDEPPSTLVFGERHLTRHPVTKRKLYGKKVQTDD